jgi:flavin-dependent dehydrogenase
MISTDVVVAGGGIAGLLIASALAPEVSVVLLEQRESFPRNKYWLTDEKAVTENPHLESCIDRRYSFFDFVANDGLTATVDGSYCLWDTDILVEHLAKELSIRGVQVLTGHRFYSLAYTANKITIRANSETIEARLFIDCMGFGSPLVGAKDVATISGYYIVYGSEVAVRGNVRPVALDNVIVDRNPAFFELFPTSKQTAHAAIILPSRQHKSERSLKNELSFIVSKSHYAEQIVLEPSCERRSYFGIVPVGRLHGPALDRVVFFGEAGQSNPAASATGLTRMLRTYRELAIALKDCLRQNKLNRKSLLCAIPHTMTRMNRLFHESLFESLLSFDSDDFRRLVRDLKDYPHPMINDLLFAEFDFTSPRTFRLALDALARPDSVLGRNVMKSLARFCVG